MLASPEQTKIAGFVALIGALVLLVLAFAGLEGRSRVLPVKSDGASISVGAPLAGLDTLFSTGPVAELVAANHRDVFSTGHFNRPKPPPEKAPEKPSPKTRSVSLTYLGLLDGGGDAPTLYVRADKETLRLAPGGVVVDDWRVADVARESLLLTNSTAATNRLVFRQALKLEVPIR
jgi:hypothetical protein